METVPYASFVNTTPTLGLSAVGQCRIHPASTEGYAAILELATKQADAVLSNTDDKAAQKKEQKKFMKQGVATAQKWLKTEMQLDVSVVMVEVFLPASDVIRTDGCLASCFLDAGCQAIVVDEEEALDAAKIPSNRLMMHFSPATNKLSDVVQKLCFGVSMSVDSSTTTVSEILDIASIINLSSKPIGDGCSDDKFKVHFQLTPSGSDDDALMSLVQAVSTDKSNPVKVALVDPTPSLMGRAYASCIRTDRPDGLFTTVVCSRQGIALGLVYSNTDSVVASLECGRAVYYSRSRKGLWRKGDTSGHFQTLHRLDLDCDRDAFRVTVTQNTSTPEEPAAFCHLHTYTCWGVPKGLRHLEDTLHDRLRNAPEGSYTQRLFQDGELLRNKLVEEAQELAEAETPDEVAGELADVLYFAMVRAAKAGVRLDAAVSELDRRARKVTRRQGDSKAFRIAAGQAILDQKGQE